MNVVDARVIGWLREALQPEFVFRLVADLRAERSNGKALEEGLSESYLPSHFACSRTAGRAGSLASQSSQRA
jgi:hypothetical protein